MKERGEFEDYIKKQSEGYSVKPPRSVWNDIKDDVSNPEPRRFNSALFAIGIIMFIILGIWGYNKYQNINKYDERKEDIASHLNEKLMKGEKLFKKECATCHDTKNKEITTGPSLCGVTNKRSKEWLYAFTRNSQKMIASGDEFANQVWKKWQPTVMQEFEYLSNDDLDCIYSYIDNTYYNCSPEKKNGNIYVNENNDTVSGNDLFDVNLEGPVDSVLHNGELFHEERVLEKGKEY